MSFLRRRLHDVIRGRTLDAVLIRIVVNNRHRRAKVIVRGRRSGTPLKGSSLPRIIVRSVRALKAAVNQGRELEKQRMVMIEAIEIPRKKLTELFEEQKRYEIAEASRVAVGQKEERRKETMELDEIGGVTYTRKQK